MQLHSVDVCVRQHCVREYSFFFIACMRLSAFHEQNITSICVCVGEVLASVYVFSLTVKDLLYVGRTFVLKSADDGVHRHGRETNCIHPTCLRTQAIVPMNNSNGSKLNRTSCTAEKTQISASVRIKSVSDSGDVLYDTEILYPIHLYPVIVWCSVREKTSG